MNWTLEKVIAECNRLSSIKKDSFSIPVTLNGRLTKTLGRVHSKINNATGRVIVERMEIAKKLLELGSDEEIKKVIAHEWAHYYLAKTTKENHGHDSLFNSLSLEMGGNAGTSTIVENFKETYKYTIVCKECGKAVAYRTRSCKVTQRPEDYKCQHCGGSLKVNQNY